MAQTNEIALRITVDGASAKTGIDQVGRQFDGLKNNIAGIERTTTALTSSISRMGHAAAAFASINFGASGLIQAADAWNSINAQLKIATGSAQEGAKAYQSVLAIAQQTGQAIDDVSTVYRRFAENSTALGISQKQVADITTTVSQAMAISGGSAASAQAALAQFSQALASGQLRGEELNSVLEQAPRLARALADGLGVPIGKLRELAAEGAITSEAMVEALGKSAGKVADEFGQLPVTVARSLTNIKTAWTDAVGSLEKGSGAFSVLASGLDGVAKNMDVIAAAGGTLAAVMLGRVVSSTVAATGASIAAAAAKRNLAAAEVQAAQAALAAATSRAANLGIMASETAATTALAAAHQRLATATAAAAAASRGAMVIGALGGPIGIITTALTVGITAWQLWSNKTEETTADAARSVAQNIDAIIGKIEEMNGRLDQVTRKSYDSTVAAAESGLRTAKASVTQLQSELEAMESQGTRWSPEGRQKQQQLEIFAKQEIDLQRQLGEARERASNVGTAALDKFISANAVGAEKISVKQSQLLQDFSRSIADTGGVLDLNIAAHKKAYDALNAGLAEIEKSGTKGSGSKDRERIAAEALRVIKDSASAEVEIIREKVAQNLLTERSGAEKTLEIQTAAIEAQKKILEQRLSKSSGADAAQIKSQLADLGQAAEIAAEKARTAFHKLDQQEREAYRSSVAALAQQTDELLKKAKASEEELATIGLSADELARLTAARYDEQIALLETEAARLRDAEGREAEVYLIEQQISAMQRLKSAEVTRPRLEAQSRAWENFSRDIERSLTDSLFRAFENGDSFGEAFAKSLQNTLKTTVLKLGVNFTMDLGKQLLGAGLNWITGGSSSSGLGSALGLASNASSAWNAVSTLSSAYNALATGVGALPGTVNIASGVGYLGGDAIGSLIQMNPQWGAAVAPGATGTAGSALGSLGTAAQTIGLVSIPFIIGGLIDKFGGGDTYQTGVALQGVFGKDQKGGFDGIVGENYSVTSGWFHGGRDTVEWTDVDITVKDMLSILAGKGSDKADGVLRGKINDEQYQKALSQVGIVVGETLVKTNLEDNLLAMSKRVGKPYQEDGKTYVDIIAPVFKSAAEMTEEEIRSNWTELVDLNSWKKIDWESNVGSGYKNRLTKYGENPDYKPRGDGWDALQTGGDVLREHLNRLNFDQGEYGQYLVSTNIQVYEFLSESLDKIYESTISAYRTLGEQLGATDIEAILESYTGNINIQNVTGLEQLLNGAAQQLNEGIGKAIFPIIDEIRAATGEAGTWADTFARVSGEAAAIGSAFKDLGLTMHNSGIANQLLATSVALTAAFGGLEGLNAALTSYYDNYYTAEEKRARTLKQLGDALRQGGLEITDSRLGEMTRAEFRSLYESIVETSGAAAPAAIAMLQMQGAFAQLTTAARESSHELHAMNALSALERSVDAEKDRIAADAESRVSALQAGIDGSMQAIDAARKSVSTLTSIFSAIENGVRRLRTTGDTAGTMLQARAYIDMSLALSKSGVAPDQAKLSDAISTVASDTSRAYASIAEFEYAQLVQASKLDALGNEIGKQKSVADMQLEALEGANRFAEEQIRVIEKSASNQIAALDSMLDQFNGQIDALNGINTSVLSVRDAVAGMNTAISGLASALNKPAPAPVSAPTSFGSSAVSGSASSSSASSSGGYSLVGNTLYFPGGGSHSISSGSVAEAQGLLISTYGLVAAGNGTYVRTRAGGGYTPPGLTLVGEEGPELVNFKQPGMVYTAAQTRNLMGGADSAIAAELRALREVNARLEARLAAIEKNTRDTHDLTYRVTEGGNVMRTVAA